MNIFKVGFFVFLLSVSAQGVASVVLDVDANGQLRGAQNVEVQGVLYDVQFVDGSFLSVFGDESNLDAASRYMSNLFSQAINDQVLLGTLFDLSPEDTFGCSDPNLCRIITPYQVDNGLTFRAYYSQNRPSANAYYSYFDGADPLIAEDYSQSGVYVFADWSVAGVPAPTGLLFLVAGLLGVLRCRRAGSLGHNTCGQSATVS